MSKTVLAIHGIIVEIDSEVEDIHSWVKFDFHLFLTQPAPAPHLRIQVILGTIPYHIVPPLVESMHGPQYVCFDSGTIRYVDYFRRALAVFDYSREEGMLYAEDAAFCYEKLYLLIQSRVGELLDKKGIHRIHALGVSLQGNAALFLIPMRGGKSTLALRLLASPAIRLLSDDTPLVQRDGTILPFPVRMGVMVGEEPKGIDKTWVRTFERSQFGSKSLIDVACYKSQIETNPCQPRLIFHGKWTFADKPELIELSRWRGFQVLFRDCVVGLGLPQVVEFFLRSPARDLWPKSMIVLRRIRAAIAVVAKARTYELRLCRDLDLNTSFIIEKLEMLRSKLP
ncbi:MAG: hypothetical protein J0M12_17755 [Deltaproteobacteria bacterium]|nr:hypothetical protein [Deltaproteobacteria bacterium]